MIGKNLFLKLAIQNIKHHKIESTFIFFAIIIANFSIFLTLAFINGFNTSFLSTFLRFEPEIRLEKEKAIPIGMLVNLPKISRRLSQLKVRFSPVLETEGLLKGNGYIAGVKILGIPYKQNFFNFSKILKKGKIFTQENQIICGEKLAQKLNIFLNKTKLKLVTSENETYVTVSGIFSTGLSDYDTYYVFVPLSVTAKLLDVPDTFASYINIQTTENTDSKNLQSFLKKFEFSTLRQRNASLFLALKLEKYAAFIVLSLMFILCGLLLTSLFVFQIINNKKSIAILKTFGFSDKKIVLIFIYQVLIYFLISISLTFTLYSISVWYLSSIEISLPENIYLISKFPLKTDAGDILLTITFSFIISSLALLIPYRFIKKIDPSLIISQRD